MYRATSITKLICYAAIFGSVVGIGAVTSVKAQQTFSCPYGSQPSCLDYGDKVCSSLGKCVDESAKCFSAYTCGYEGFVCKSELDDVADEYQSLFSKYNSLINEYNDLLARHKRDVQDYNDLQESHSNLVFCVARADTLDEAQNCSLMYSN